VRRASAAPAPPHHRRRHPPRLRGTWHRDLPCSLAAVATKNGPLLSCSHCRASSDIASGLRGYQKTSPPGGSGSGSNFLCQVRHTHKQQPAVCCIWPRPPATGICGKGPKWRAAVVAGDGAAGVICYIEGPCRSVSPIRALRAWRPYLFQLPQGELHPGCLGRSRMRPPRHASTPQKVP
jgi:hypothetical protein